MACYEVLINRSALEEIARIGNKRDRGFVIRRIRALAEDPRPPGCRKVSGRNLWRVRQGRYRIIYSIEDTRLLVLVVKVGHRRDVYR